MEKLRHELSTDRERNREKKKAGTIRKWFWNSRFAHGFKSIFVMKRLNFSFTFLWNAKKHPGVYIWTNKKKTNTLLNTHNVDESMRKMRITCKIYIHILMERREEKKYKTSNDTHHVRSCLLRNRWHKHTFNHILFMSIVNKNSGPFWMWSATHTHFISKHMK